MAKARVKSVKHAKNTSARHTAAKVHTIHAPKTTAVHSLSTHHSATHKAKKL
jgi:hypothetical protein